MIGGARARRVGLLREPFPSEVDVKRVTTADVVYRLGLHLTTLRDRLDNSRALIDEAADEGQEAALLKLVGERGLDTLIELFAEMSAFVPLPLTQKSLEQLRAIYVDLQAGKWRPGLTFEDIENSITAVTTVVTRELTTVNLFYAAPVGDFDVTRLIEQGPFLDKPHRRLLPKEALRDVRDAGRALAFGLPTAVGFHLFRSMEAAMRLYFPLINYTPKDSDRNWNNYINAMREGGVAKRITDCLDHIRQEYRNPITHPDKVLTRDEAQALMAVAMSAIRMMLVDLAARKAGTAP